MKDHNESNDMNTEKNKKTASVPDGQSAAGGAHDINAAMRMIPKVDAIMNMPQLASAGAAARAELKRAAREFTDDMRRRILSGDITHENMPDEAEICRAVEARMKKGAKRSLRKTVNATGIVIHTNLGRAPLGETIISRAADIAAGYSNLEYDIEKGERSQRNLHVEKLICDMTGAEAAVVVNNNASAVFLALNSIAAGRKTAVSRGELVEIGGSFRVPDIMSSSGAELIEIGTTNKTKASDYVRAVEEKGAEVLLKVHTSNFKIEGFTENVNISQLADIGRKYGCPVIYDIGAAFLVQRELVGIHEGETARGCIEAGADIIMFSGDKLMGSTQAGIIAGKRRYIDRMRTNSFMRMLRPDKLQLAVLEETLIHYMDPRDAAESVPVLKMLSMSKEMLTDKAEKLAARLRAACPACTFEVTGCSDEAGGGSLPGVVINGAAVSVFSETRSAEELEIYLRAYDTPVIARIHSGRLMISVRTLLDGDDDIIEAAFAKLA